MSNDRVVNIGLVQSTCTSDTTSNMAKAVSGIRAAASQHANIICLQELFTTLYFCDKEDYAPFALAETIPGTSTGILQPIAKELGVVIIASLFEKRTEGVYHNTTAVIDADGTYLGKYRKMHIPDDPAYFEKFYFTPGDLGFKSFKTAYGNLGVLICWDQWYPEAARLTALAGAEILFYPTAIGWADGEEAKIKRVQHDAWETIQRSHAVANGIPVVSVNRVGHEGNQTFWGGSFVAGNQGEILFKASHDKEEVNVVAVDLARSNAIRIHWPFLRDRRIDAYSDITKRFID